MNTSKTLDLKPFRMNTYRKTGEGGVIQTVNELYPHGFYRPQLDLVFLKRLNRGIHQKLAIQFRHVSCPLALHRK
jgi:hypothetical protein